MNEGSNPLKTFIYSKGIQRIGSEKMDTNEFTQKIMSMQSGEYYPHKGRNGVEYQFHKSQSSYDVWVAVKGYNVSHIKFDRMIAGGSIIGLGLGNEYVGCMPKYQLGVE